MNRLYFGRALRPRRGGSMIAKGARPLARREEGVGSFPTTDEQRRQRTRNRARANRRASVGTLLAACALACTALLLFGSCAQERESGSSERITTLPDYDDVIGDDLMLALHQAKNFHHIADVYLQNGKVEKASEAVRQILSIPFPADAPESEDVLLDARARLAKLLVTEGRIDEAMKIVDTGIASAKRQSFFLSNLYTVKGEVLEARAVSLDDTDKAAATTAREQAIEARMKSIEIDTQLQKKLNEAAP